eukprot:TRINITY_DN12108_c0_g1_i1.p1 TRINITY_DN12108_c0_g1~~TRINITY_DN12108_c0_g1_i1.p1  ORF type:complete len:632 (+),score=138.89 TRINITY_DN12108_c0_g1_i1:182-2077(+)
MVLRVSRPRLAFLKGLRARTWRHRDADRDYRSMRDRWSVNIPLSMPRNFYSYTNLISTPQEYWFMNHHRHLHDPQPITIYDAPGHETQAVHTALPPSRPEWAPRITAPFHHAFNAYGMHRAPYMGTQNAGRRGGPEMQEKPSINHDGRYFDMDALHKSGLWDSTEGPKYWPSQKCPANFEPYVAGRLPDHAMTVSVTITGHNPDRVDKAIEDVREFARTVVGTAILDRMVAIRPLVHKVIYDNAPVALDAPAASEGSAAHSYAAQRVSAHADHHRDRLRRLAEEGSAAAVVTSSVTVDTDATRAAAIQYAEALGEPLSRSTTFAPSELLEFLSVNEAESFWQEELASFVWELAAAFEAVEQLRWERLPTWYFEASISRTDRPFPMWAKSAFGIAKHRRRLVVQVPFVNSEIERRLTETGRWLGTTETTVNVETTTAVNFPHERLTAEDVAAMDTNTMAARKELEADRELWCDDDVAQLVKKMTEEATAEGSDAAVSDVARRIHEAVDALQKKKAAARAAKQAQETKEGRYLHLLKDGAVHAEHLFQWPSMGTYYESMAFRGRPVDRPLGEGLLRRPPQRAYGRFPDQKMMRPTFLQHFYPRTRDAKQLWRPESRPQDFPLEAVYKRDHAVA